MNKGLNFGIFALLLNVSLCAAQDTLTWDDALVRARQKNPDLLAAQRNLESRRAGYKESFNDVLPSVDLSNSYTRSQGDNSQSDRWSARGSISLDLFNMGDYAGIRSSRSTLDQSQASYQAASADVLLALRRAFANLIFSQEQMRVSEIVRDIRKKNASLVSLRYDSGRESKGNKLRSQAELMDSDASVNQARRDHQVAQQEFSRQLGEENFDVLTATGALETTEVVDSSAPLTDIAANHPDVLLGEAQVRGAKAAVASARSVLWPNLSASYSRSVQGPDEFPNDHYNWTASGVLSLPIFSGGPTSAYYSVAAAKRAEEGAEESFRSTRYRVLSDLRTAQADFANAVEQVNVQRAFLNAARQRNQEADIRYSNGLMTYEDWERIVTERVNFEQSVIQAERNAVFAEAQWNNARGIGLGDQQ